jgi:nucleoside-triphosphatase THEP1
MAGGSPALMFETSPGRSAVRDPPGWLAYNRSLNRRNACPMSAPGQFTQLCAIRRTDPIAADTLIAAVAERAKAAGLELAGVLQRDVLRPGRRRCDMDLIDLATGRIIRISEDRGNLARGCRMNASALVDAAEMVEETIRTGAPDLVILNKFGKAEEEGGGMRDAIAASLSAGVPVFIGVGTPAIPALEQFAGDLVTLIDADEAMVAAWLSAHFGERI